MKSPTLIVLALAVLALGGAQAQDIAGLEDCTKTSGLDKRTGCFQSNIEVLSRMILKTGSDAQQKLSAANAQIAALQHTVADLQGRIEALEKAAKKPNAKP